MEETLSSIYDGEKTDGTSSGEILNFVKITGVESADDLLSDVDNQETVKASDTLPAECAPTHSISFESNGGTDTDSLSVKDGEAAQAPSEPTREG